MHRKAFAHRSFYTEKLLSPRSLTQRSFLRTDGFAQISLYIEEFLHAKCLHTKNIKQRLRTEKLSHAEAFARERALCTEKLLHTEAFTLGGFYTKKPSHRNFDTQTRLHRGVLTQGRVCTQKPLRTEAFLHRVAFTQKSLHREVLRQRSLYTQRLLQREAFCTEKS